MSEPRPALGAAVRELRGARGLSQDELAARSGLHRTYVGGIESGRRNPTCTSLARLARGLGLRPWELPRRSEQLSGEGDS